VQRIGLFLAMLELVRLRRITVRQEDLVSDVELELLGEEEGTEGEAPDATTKNPSPFQGESEDELGKEAEAGGFLCRRWRPTPPSEAGAARSQAWFC
jgi:hypothetical protein